MKKLSLIILVSVLIAACNNSAEGDKSRDTVNTGTTIDNSGDTSSYERMPNKINDSVPQ